MATKKIWMLLCLMLVLAGCAGAAPKGAATGAAEPASEAPQAGFRGSENAPPPPPGSPEFSASKPASPSATSDTGGRSKSASTEAAPSRSSRGADQPKEAPADTRPGLGTEWGETRTSRVHDVAFVRDSSRPFASTMLQYNDRRGVDAMASRAAKSSTGFDTQAGGGAVTIAIKDSSGNALEAVHAGDRTLVVGQAGQRYSITLTNHSSHRFESVVTVDGLDVINGKSGTLENRGYVLLPFATLEIEGFRQSNAAVAAFRFAAVGESYAAQMGAARNVGVIGIALFSERGDAFVDERELRTRETANPFPADPRFAQPPRR